MEHIPVFSFDRQISPEDGWHDKLGFEFLPFILDSPDAEDCRNFLHFLSAPSRQTQEAQDEDWLGAYGWIFGASAGARGGFARSVRRGSLSLGDEILPPPLFSGRVTLQSYREDRRIKVALEANPSRLIHHHPEALPDRPSRLRLRRGLSHAVPRPVWDGEFSFDGSDNWIPQTSALNSVWRRPYNASSRCVAEIRRAVRSELRRVRDTHGFSLSNNRPEPYTLANVETYWEFSHPDPIGLVFSLAPLLMSFSRGRFVATTYEGRAIRRGEIVRNCPSFGLPLGHGEWLAVYAKTNRRVRFEIRLNLRENSGCLDGRITAEGSEAFLAKLRDARIHSARLLNDVFAFFRGRAASPQNSASTSELLSAISSALRRSQNFPTVLSLLLHHGKLERVPGLSAEVNALKRAGIIERHGPSRSAAYIPTPRFTLALRKLQRKGLASLFDARDR